MQKRLIVLISSSIQGGAQNHVLNLVLNLRERYSILAVCPPGYLADRLSEEKLDLHLSEVNFSMVLALRKLFRREQALHQNVIINTHLLGTAFWCSCATALLEIRKVATLHNPVIYDGMGIVRRLAFPTILKLVAYNTAGFIAVSKAIANSIRNQAKAVVTYVPNAVPRNALASADRVHVLDARKPRVAIIGRLSIEKGHAFFIDAASKIVREIPGVTFYIIGDGDLRTGLEQQVRNLGLENNFVFTGFVPQPVQILRDIDLVVIASLFEGIPLALLEVMNIGIPVVATKVGGIPDVIRHECDGLLVEAGNADAIYKNVMRLLTDNELYRRLSANAKIKMTTEFDYTKSIEEYVRALGE